MNADINTHVPVRILESAIEDGVTLSFRKVSGTIKVTGDGDTEWFYKGRRIEFDADRYRSAEKWSCGRERFTSLTEAKAWIDAR
jgi:hypothetical protein